MADTARRASILNNQSLEDTQKAEFDKWMGINEDEILRGMTEEELANLNNELTEMDPDSSMLAAGLRQRDQTTKAPTGTLNRDALMTHLEDEAKAIDDKDDLVPFEQGKVRGKKYVPKSNVNLDDGFGGGAVKLEPEIEEALKHANDAELTDLAAILGLHTMMDNEQYYASLNATDGAIANTVGWRETTKCKLPVVSPEILAQEPKNETDVTSSLQQLQSNDSSLTSLNLNNIRNISIITLKDYAKALSTNTALKDFQLVSTRLNDAVGLEFAEALKTNKTLEKLNLETNYMSVKGVSAILEALNESGNTSLTELKVDNQKGLFGPGGEQKIADLLGVNGSLIKFGYQFKFPGPRQKAVAKLTENADMVRQRRKKH